MSNVSRCGPGSRRLKPGLYGSAKRSFASAADSWSTRTVAGSTEVSGDGDPTTERPEIFKAEAAFGDRARDEWRAAGLTCQKLDHRRQIVRGREAVADE